MSSDETGAPKVGCTRLLVRQVDAPQADDAVFDATRRFRSRQQDFSTAKAAASLVLTDWSSDKRARTQLDGIDIAVVVFSLGDSATLDYARQCIGRLRKNGKLKSGAPVWLVGNKLDLLGVASMDKLTRIAKVRADAKDLARRETVPYAEVSARTGEGVQALFRDIARLVRRSA